MRESTFPWPWKGENGRLSLLVLGWILLLNLWALIAIDFLPISRKSAWDPIANLRAPLFARYDSGWYDSIVRYGYQAPPQPGQASTHAFFPLYPMVGRYLHLATGADSYQTALLVSYAALFLAVPLFVEEARARFGKERARAALPFLLLYPVAFFLAAIYTESLLLVLALPILTGTSAGIPRYTLAVYPAHFAAASLCEDRPWLRRLWLGVSTFGLLLNSAFFTNWHFIS